MCIRDRALATPLVSATGEGYTVIEAQGGYTDDAGNLVENGTLVYTGIHAGEQEVLGLVDDLKAALHVESCLLYTSLGFADVIVFGSSETGTGKRGLHSALENVYEAVVAALYLDGGIGAAQEFVERTLIPRMSLDMAREPENPKSALQEKLQENGITPTYKLVETQGPPHDRTFVAQVFAGTQGLARGTGRTKKEAESQAAKSTLARLGEFFGLGVDEETRAEKAEAAKLAKAEKAAARAEEKARKKSERAQAKQRKQG